MSGVKHTPWKVEDCGSPEYLDGIQSRYTVRGRGKMPIAYAFDADEALLIAAAPDLLEALESIVLMQAENRGDGVKTHLALSHLCVTAQAAIARARGEQDGGRE